MHRHWIIAAAPRFGAAVILGSSLLSLGGCASDAGPEKLGTTAQAASLAGVTATIEGRSVMVHYTGMTPSPENWVAIVDPSYPEDAHAYWDNTDGQSDGSVSFANVRPGVYEARVFHDWPNGGYGVVARSEPFVIDGAAIKAGWSHPVGAPIEVAFASFPATGGDWVALYKFGAADQSYITWRYTDGGSDGAVTFDVDLPPGIYVARGFQHGGFDRVAESAIFSVAGSVGLEVAPKVAIGAAFDVKFSEVPLGKSNWIAVAAAGAPPEDYLGWTFLPYESFGTVSMAGLPAGQYEARLFYDWTGTGSLEVRAQKAFSVEALPKLIAPAKLPASTPIEVSFSDVPVSGSNWITVAAAGSAPDAYLAYAYLPEAASGTVSLAGQPAGDYEVRLFLDWVGTHSYDVQAVSKVTVKESLPTLIAPARVAPSTPIEVSFSEMPVSSSNWLTVAAAGSAPDAYLAYAYLPEAASGTVSLAGQPAGDYEVRLFLDWAGTYAYDVTVVRKVTVKDWLPTLGAPAQLAPSTPIEVGFSDVPVSGSNWVTVAAVGSAPDAYLAYAYLPETESGTVSLAGQPAGEYEVRLFLDWAGTLSYDVKAVSKVTVKVPASVTVSDALTAGEPVVVDYAEVTSSASNWVAIAVAGAPAGEYVAWQYLPEGASGQVSLPGLPAGSYEARIFYDWLGTGSFEVRASRAFTVAP